MSSESQRADSDLPLEYLDESQASPKPAKKAARKAAKKAVKKTARKAAKKAVASVDAVAEGSAKSESTTQETAKTNAKPDADRGEFRPADFKGRGSHFEGQERVEVHQEAKTDSESERRRVVSTPADRSQEGDGADDRKEPNESRGDRGQSDRQHDTRPSQGDIAYPGRQQESRHGGQGDGGQSRQHEQRSGGGQGDGGQRNKQGFGNKKKGKGGQGGQQFQKGGKHNKQGKFNKPFQGQGGQGQGKQGGGWRQPLPPSERDFVEGDLPKAADFNSKQACEALLLELDCEEPIDLSGLYELKLDALVEKVRSLGATLEAKPGRKQTIEELFRTARDSKKAFKDVGYLDLTDDGYGFVVHTASSYQLKPESVYVPASLVKEYSLKRGHLIEVVAKAPSEGERCPAALKIVSVMGSAPEEVEKVTPFEDLIPYYPTERLVLETPMPSNNKKDVSMRAFDLLTPIGFGQRGLIVAPPRTGKTVLLQGLANSIQTNWPDVHLIVLLIDERPEEVTDFRRQVQGEVVSSTFDETPTSHVHAAEMVVEKARRMVEHGQKVVILLDSITRLARAYNALASNSGKIMSGGIEATALQKPKRFFGSARNIEGGGSLTIMASALVETGSKMDEVIFEEFKGTGNMELHLDRDLINKRIFPAINFERSGTRKEELLYHPQELEKVYALRRVMLGVPGVEAMEMLVKRLKVTKNNVEFLMSLK